jgi:hypothetical protein
VLGAGLLISTTAVAARPLGTPIIFHRFCVIEVCINILQKNLLAHTHTQSLSLSLYYLSLHRELILSPSTANDSVTLVCETKIQTWQVELSSYYYDTCVCMCDMLRPISFKIENYSKKNNSSNENVVSKILTGVSPFT